jgi:hypothetical protein
MRYWLDEDEVRDEVVELDVEDREDDDVVVVVVVVIAGDELDRVLELVELTLVVDRAIVLPGV